MQRYKGMLFVIISAVIFGVTPILGRITFDGGSNSINLTFLRAILCLPILYAILKHQRIPLKLTAHQLRSVAITGIGGSALTTILLYSSYNYIAVGAATTLHFVYPVIVALVCILFFGERMNRWKLLALVFGSAGVVLFMDWNVSGSAAGMILSLLSGVTYAFYIICVDRLGLKNMYYLQLTFYLCVATAASSGLYGLLSGSLTLHLTPMAWLFSLLVSLLASVCGLSLFQLGVRYVGSTVTAVLSTFEPLISVILGVLILHESFTALKLAGCLLIVASVICIARSGPAPPEEGTTQTKDCD